MNQALIARKMEDQDFTKKETEDYLWELSCAAQEDRNNADSETCTVQLDD